MYFESLSCAICSRDYDLEEHTPKILPLCGHSLCSQCLGKILRDKKPKCPFDKILLSFDISIKYPDNRSIKDIIQEVSENDICLRHSKPLLMACINDKQKVCVDCINVNKHHGHLHKPMSEIICEAQNKMPELKHILKTLKGIHKSLQGLEDIKEKLIEKIKSQNIPATQDLKKIALQIEVDRLFHQEKNRLSSLTGEESPIRKNALHILESFRKMRKTNKINTLKDVLSYVYEIDLQSDLQKLQKRMEEFIASVDEYVGNILKSDFLFYPNYNEHEDNQITLPREHYDLQKELGSLIIDGCLEIQANTNKGYVLIGTKRRPSTSTINLFGMQNLREVRVFVDQPNFPTIGFNALTLILNRMKRTESIVLFVVQQSIIDEPNLLQLFSLLFNKATEVENIAITFRSSEVSDTLIKPFSEKILSKCFNIKSFRLSLSKAMVSDSGLQELSTAIASFAENLSRFVLNIGFALVTKEGIHSMLMSLPNVQEFILNLDGLYISMETTELLLMRICSMLNLKKVQLSLKDTRISTESLNKIRDSYLVIDILD